VTRRLVIGSTPATDEAVYIGSKGWTARVQRTEAAGRADSGNPFGAAVAACIGAGVVFRDVFAKALPNDDSNALVWSPIEDAPSWRAGDLGEVYFAGLGAI